MICNLTLRIIVFFKKKISFIIRIFRVKNFAVNRKKAYICTRKKKEFFYNQGQLPEWPNGADCNSAGVAFGGSNPSLPTNFKLQLLEIVISLKFVYASPH